MRPLTPEQALAELTSEERRQVEQRAEEKKADYKHNMRIAEALKRLAHVYQWGARDRSIFPKHRSTATWLIRELVNDWVRS